MAHLTHFARHLTEESVARAASTSKAAQQNSAFKSKAFGELRNILHPTLAGATPFVARSASGKVARQMFGTPAAAAKKKPTPKLPQQQQQLQQQEAKDVKQSTVAFDADEIEELDAFDFPHSSCNKECSMSLGEIWSEQNTFDDDFLKKLLESTYDDDDKEVQIDVATPDFANDDVEKQKDLVLFDALLHSTAVVADDDDVLKTPPFVDCLDDADALQDIMDLPF